MLVFKLIEGRIDDKFAQFSHRDAELAIPVHRQHGWRALDRVWDGILGGYSASHVG